MTLEQELESVPEVEALVLPAFHAPRPMTLSEFIRERRDGTTRRGTEQPNYAVPVDDDIRRTLGLIPFASRIDDILEKMIQLQIGPALHNAVRVSPRQFPEVYRVVDRCANRLGIAVPRVMVVPDVHMRSMTVGTSENHFIMLTSTLVERSNDEELAFLIGHECGHIHCRHLSYLALARALVDWTSNLASLSGLSLIVQPLRMMLQVPLATWQRKAELTCDRAGLICSHDPNISLRALAKHVVQAPALADRLNLDEYLRQIEAAAEESTLSKLPEYLQAFPFIPKRMMALKLFSRSKLYYEWTEQDAPEDALSKEDLEKSVDKVTSIL